MLFIGRMKLLQLNNYYSIAMIIIPYSDKSF